MLTNVKAAPKAKAAKAAAPAPIAAETLPATVAPKAPSAKQLALQAHDAAGFTGKLYDGLSKTRNAGHEKPLNLAAAAVYTDAQLSPRMLSTLRELAKAHGGNAFPVIGIDRKQAAIFVNSGFLLGYTGDMRGNVTLSPDAIKRYS